MFGKKKTLSQPGIPDDLYGFLTEADGLYIRAFETRSIGLLKEHFTRDCCIAISRWIVAEASSRYFCDEKFRQTTWTIQSESLTQIVLEKDVVYKDIRLSMSRSLKVSDDYRELWSVTVTPEEYWVNSVSPA